MDRKVNTFRFEYNVKLLFQQNTICINMHQPIDRFSWSIESIITDSIITVFIPWLNSNSYLAINSIYLFIHNKNLFIHRWIIRCNFFSIKSMLSINYFTCLDPRCRFVYSSYATLFSRRVCNWLSFSLMNRYRKLETQR